MTPRVSSRTSPTDRTGSASDGATPRHIAAAGVTIEDAGGRAGVTVDAMNRAAAWVVMVLGTLVLVGGVLGIVNGIRDDDPTAPLARLLVMLLVVLALRRAKSQLWAHQE